MAVWSVLILLIWLQLAGKHVNIMASVRKMANSSSHFYSTVLYINHWIINNDIQFLEQMHEHRIPFSRLVVPITEYNLDFFQLFDSLICSLLLSGITWTGKTKVTNLVFRVFSQKIWSSWLPLRWRNGKMCVSFTKYPSTGYFNSYILKENMFY